MISLSNLFKQHYVVNLENEKRVINADEKFINNNQPVKETVFPELIEDDSTSEEILDGFLAGLEAEVVTVDPQVVAEEIIEKAKAEAEAILAAAKQKQSALAILRKKKLRFCSRSARPRVIMPVLPR